MNCDYVQEKLSAFLDREESLEDFDEVLSHLYDCKVCKDFFSSAIRLRSLAGEDRRPYPVELDDAVLNNPVMKDGFGIMTRSLTLPVYAASVLAAVLLIVSFTFGYMAERGAHQKEIDTLIQSRPSQVMYQMPTQVVYPVSLRDVKGELK